MKLVFAHGWGLDPQIWNSTVAHLPPEWNYELIDFGFLGASPQLTFTGDIAVGHSLGFLWLLSQDHPWKAAISLNGFTCFQQSGRFPTGIPRGGLEQMKQVLATNPHRCVKTFYERYLSKEPLPSSLDPQRLLWGLDFLQTHDARDIMLPTLALHSQDDPLISQEMTDACFDHIIIARTGGHMLPTHEPHWCIREMVEFLKRTDET